MLPARFDELSEDTPLNRVLKAAVARLVGLTRVAANSRRLAELSARFEFVGDSVAPATRGCSPTPRSYDASRLILIYPWHREMDANQGVVRRWSVAKSDCLLDVATVDVGRPDEIGSTLQEIYAWEPAHRHGERGGRRGSPNVAELRGMVAQ